MLQHFGRKNKMKETSVLDDGLYRINRSEVGYKNLGWIRGADEENLCSRKNEGYVGKLGEYKSNAISTTVRQLSITGTTKKAVSPHTSPVFHYGSWWHCTVIPRLTKIIRSGITFVSRNVISRRFL